MSIANNILRSYRQPAKVVRAILDQGPREDRAVLYLMVACGLVFVGQWPVAARQAHLDPSVPLEARLGGALLAWLFIMPLLCYGLAALSRLIARGFGGQGTGYGARVALFWTLLVIAPLLLLRGMVAGLIGPGLQLTLVDGVTTVAFLLHWAVSIREAERPIEAAG